MCVNFSNDLVLVSTHIGHEVFCDCECLRITIPKLPFRETLIEPALVHAGISDSSCHLHQFYTKVIGVLVDGYFYTQKKLSATVI